VHVSWIDNIVERRIAEAIARDELVPDHLKGADLDLDTQRPDGWWAEEFVRRERARLDADDSPATPPAGQPSR